MCNTHGRIWHLVSFCGQSVSTCGHFVDLFVLLCVSVVVLWHLLVINLCLLWSSCISLWSLTLSLWLFCVFLSFCVLPVGHLCLYVVVLCLLPTTLCIFVVVWLIDPTGNVDSHLIMRFCPAAPSLVPGATTPSGSAPVCPSSPLFRSSSRGVLSHTVEEEKTHKKRECTDPLRSHKFNIFILPRLPKSAWECIQWVHKSQHCQRGDGDARGRRHSVHSRAGTLRQIRATLIPSVGLMRF